MAHPREFGVASGSVTPEMGHLRQFGVASGSEAPEMAYLRQFGVGSGSEAPEIAYLLEFGVGSGSETPEMGTRSSGIAVVLAGRSPGRAEKVRSASPRPEPGRRRNGEFTSARVESLVERSGPGTASRTTAEAVLDNEITTYEQRVRIDVRTSTPGLRFADAWEARLTMESDGQPFFVVSKPHLVAAQRAAGRPMDLEDIRLLEVEEP